MKQTQDTVDNPTVGQRYHVSWSYNQDMTFTLVDKGEKYGILGRVRGNKLTITELSDLRHTAKSAKYENRLNN